MRTNTQTNQLIKWIIIAMDFVVLNAILFVGLNTMTTFVKWSDEEVRMFMLVCNCALGIGEYVSPSVIHQRMVGADSILKRGTLLVLVQTLVSYLILRAFRFDFRVGLPLLVIGAVLVLVIIVLRLTERWALKRMRRLGYNTRNITLVGSDDAIKELYAKLMNNPTYGYRLKAYYGAQEDLPRQGSVEDFISLIDMPDQLKLGDELYLCISRDEKEIIGRVAHLCDSNFVKFYYIPIPEQALPLQSVMLEDVEVFTTYTSPLEDPLNRVIKRTFDVILSLLFLIPTAILIPFIVFFIKRQSPGPIFFKQKRTGLDGRVFNCLKFRSMHVNADADRVQATKDDPRKFPFGNFIRKTNIDELPQFWNVLRGDMSIVGPRPHMLAHTEQYSKLISKYMIRHFVKPGLTGWAQVTGFRGETHELWQMEGRVERDIWYIQHWSLWLDARIIWMTLKTFFVHDEKAY